MTERYIAKVVKVVDSGTIVINAGSEKGIQLESTFLIVGLGETILDPDTQESLGSLEIVRGKARVSHVQGKMATLVSAEFDRAADIKEIKKISTAGRSALSSIFGPQETVTESIKPAEPVPRPFVNVEVGDLVIQA